MNNKNKQHLREYIRMEMRVCAVDVTDRSLESRPHYRGDVTKTTMADDSEALAPLRQQAFVRVEAKS